MHLRHLAPTLLATSFLCATALLFGCSPKSIPWGGGSGGVQATFRPLRGGYGTGTMILEQNGKLVRISGTLEGLAPGAHGIHIHARADCSGQAANPADPHFNPYGKRHGDLSRPDHPVQTT